MNQRRLSPFTLWALAFGCCIGWGSFIMPGTTFLPTAGTLGTTVAILLGACVMILIAYNYHFVMQRDSGAGGVFSFTKKIFGGDHAFMCAWFLWIAYISLLWANATAVTLMGRNLFGDVLKVGFHYEFAGYDVFGGEVAVTILLLWIFGLLFARAIPVTKVLQGIAAVILICGVVFIFVSAVDVAPTPPKFYFAENSPPVKQIFIIFTLIPWAFIGFETIAHYTKEFHSDVGKAFPIMTAAIICAAVVYIFMANLAALRFPAQFKSSADYMNNLDKLTGLEQVPTFYAVSETFGAEGKIFLLAVISAALCTSLIGYYRITGSLTRIFAHDNVLPKWLSTRRHATIFIFLISLAVPFFGRTVVSWLTDITTIGATIAYGYTSACAYVLAKRENNRRAKVTGAVGTVFAVLFSFFLLIPNLWSISVLTNESYFLLAIWGLLGFAYFNYLFKRNEKIFGNSPSVWLVMFFIVFFASLMWMREKMYVELVDFIQETHNFYEENSYAPRFAFMNMQIHQMRVVLLENTMIMLMFALAALLFLFRIHTRIKRKEVAALEEQRRKAEESSRAKTTFLSNMSHDIRTPMNAIIGYTTLAKRPGITYDELKSFMLKIDVSGKHLLDLINDILEMSRIESGRMELELTEVDLRKNLLDLKTMFATQMEAKGVSFTVDAEKVRHRCVICDKNRWNRVLLNLVGNAYKFTPSGKSVAVMLSELDDGSYELSVKDTGIGMSQEFAKKIFEAFEREKTSTVSGIQGTGLGTAITKSIVDLMGGTIDVVTEKDVGTEFIVHVKFKIVDNPAIIEELAESDETAESSEPAQIAETSDDAVQIEETADETADELPGAKILLVDDIEVNREIATMMLEQFGFTVEQAVDGRDALDKATKNSYDLILMDIQMPVMNGYESARAIRDSGVTVPIIAMTANAMPEDVQAAKVAGMNDHIAKPLDLQKMMATIQRALKK